nr:MAG: minor capsid protein 2 [Bacteriophage sp.]
MPKQNKYDKEHMENLSAYEQEVDRLYRQIIQQAATIGISISGDFNPDKPFSFDDYPTIKKRVEKLLSALQSGLSAVILNGIDAEWTLANNKNSELSRMVFGDNIGRLTEEQYRRYFSTNDNARIAFKERKENGLNLSDRVWRYTNQFKDEIELALDLGIRSGLSADEMTQDLRDYLRYPDKLFRRVRDEHGQLQLSKRAAAFHPGQGVYRSSYKNARRLAATETNMAYMTADYERWQQLDFVVGIEIRLSNNHTLNGEPFVDICDELKGRYPKDFKFTGWHPHCRCHAITILKTDEEIAEDTQKILNGEELDGNSINCVDDVPDNFKKWLQDNEARAKRSYSMPYFIRDNEKYLPDNYKNLYAMKKPYDTYEEYEAAMRYNKKYAGFSADIARNNRELSEVLPVLQGKIMNFAEADGNRCNPKFTIENAENLGYWHNCQTCTMTYELRRRGFNVEAKPSPLVKKVMREFDLFAASKGANWTLRFLNSDGTPVKYKYSGYDIPKDTIATKNAYIQNETKQQGRYEVYCAWKGKNAGAHVFIVERQKNGELLWFDPQSGRRGGAFKDYLQRMSKLKISILRIDDKLINPLFAERLIKAI